MALPKLDIITTSTTIPSTQQNITIRPFLVKEQKILLTAMASDSPDDMAQATRQIVNNCIVAPEVDVDKLELFDLEYLILQLRIISIGEITKIRFLPREGVDCAECKKPRDVEINLREAKVNFEGAKDKKIKLTEDIGLIMKYPNAKMLGSLEAAKNSDSPDALFKVIWSCVEAIYDKENVSSTKEVTQKEGMEFLESLTGKQFTAIEEFLASMPKLQHTAHIQCNTCGFEQDYTFTGLDNFLG